MMLPGSPYKQSRSNSGDSIILNMEEESVYLGTTNKTKTVILIRHAQSEENVKVIDLIAGLERLRKLRCPNCKCLASTCSLLRLTIDSAVSSLGEDQIMDMHRILAEDQFWQKLNPDLIVCSPLIRAKETCEGVLPMDRKGLNVTILSDLEEATPYEHVFSRTLLQRIERFKHWLAHCDEETIVVVGHSQYFKKMLNRASLMRNCDVWKVTVNCAAREKQGPADTPSMEFHWSEPVLLYRTDLAEQHVFDKFIKATDDGIVGGAHGGAAATEGHIISSTSPPICSLASGGSAVNNTSDNISPRHLSGTRGTVLAGGMGGDTGLLRGESFDEDGDRNDDNNSKGKPANVFRPEASL